MFARFFAAALVVLLATVQPVWPQSSFRFDENGTIGIIRPPDGWLARTVPEFSEVRITNSFYDAGRPSQQVLLGYIEAPNKRSLAEVVDAIVASLSSQPDVKLVSSHSARLCGGKAAGWIMHYSQPPLDIAEAIIVGKNRGVAAIYVRKTGESDDPKALNAIDSFCLVPFE